MSAKPEPLTDYEQRAEALLREGVTQSWNDKLAILAKELERGDAVIAALRVAESELRSHGYSTAPSVLAQIRAALALVEAA